MKFKIFTGRFLERDINAWLDSMGVTINISEFLQSSTNGKTTITIIYQETQDLNEIS